MIIETNRLILEKATLDDSAFFLELLNSPNWIKYIGDKKVKNLEDSAKYIQNSLINSYEKYGYGLYKITMKVDGTTIGICGFVKRDYLQKADIGFAILPKFEGLGYTTEAALAFMKYGLSELGFDEILAITTKENTKSQILLTKIGLFRKGTIQPDKSKNKLLLYSNLISKISVHLESL